MNKYLFITTIWVTGLLGFSTAVFGNEPVLVEENVVETIIIPPGNSQKDLNETAYLPSNASALPDGPPSKLGGSDTFVDVSPTVPCRPPYTFIFDKDASMVVGGNIFISSLHAYQSIDDAFIPSTEGIKDWTMMAGRFGKYLLEGILFNMGMIAQHEIFGHGARAREFNMHIRKYRVTPWSGYTYFKARDFQRLSPSEKTAFISGGVEGTYILAKQLRNQWLDSKYIDEREGHFYLQNVLDQTRYVLSTRHYKDLSPLHGHDIGLYIHEVNKWHRQRVLTAHDLRRKILLDFVDPYTFYSFFSLIKYVVDGTQGFEYPMIPLGNYQYLPGFRIALAPYGPEYQFINYMRGPEHSIQTTLRYGDNGDKESYGFTMEITRILSSDLLNFDGRIDLWNQPKMHARTSRRAESKFGAAASIIARYRLAPCFEVMGQLGYKTTGYIPGEFLRHTPIIRAGFSLQI